MQCGHPAHVASPRVWVLPHPQWASILGVVIPVASVSPSVLRSTTPHLLPTSPAGCTSLYRTARTNSNRSWAPTTRWIVLIIVEGDQNGGSWPVTCWRSPDCAEPSRAEAMNSDAEIREVQLYQCTTRTCALHQCITRSAVAVAVA